MALQKGEGRFQIIHRPWSVAGRSDEFDAWITQPDADGRFPSLVVCHDIFGVTPQMKEFAKLLARMGYATAVPDLYYRVGGVPPGATREEAENVAGRFTDGRVLADAEDTVAFLQSKTSAVDDRLVGIVGFGMGGRLALLLAQRLAIPTGCAVCVSPELGKTELVDGEVRTPTGIDAAESVDVPVLAVFGGKDELADRTDVEKLAQVLGAGGAVVTYPSAGRDLLEESLPDYDPAVATDIYDRIIRFLDDHLGHEPK